MKEKRQICEVCKDKDTKVTEKPCCDCSSLNGEYGLTNGDYITMLMDIQPDEEEGD